jgi:hypothetical protein
MGRTAHGKDTLAIMTDLPIDKLLDRRQPCRFAAWPAIAR